jgi:glycosyltransferase involved in cell wall biosynthesis
MSIGWLRHQRINRKYRSKVRGLRFEVKSKRLFCNWLLESFFIILSDRKGMKAIMKILFDARVLGKQMHGIARYCQNVLQQLLAEDRGYTYLVLIGRSEIRDRFSPSVPVRWLQTRTPLYSIQEQLLIPYLVRREAFDLFHSPTFAIPLPFSTKGIITIHDLIHLLFPQDYGFRHRLYYSMLTRRAVSRGVKIFTVSEHSKKDIITLLKGHDRQITVTPNGLDSQWVPQSIDATFMDRYGLNKGFVLFVGNPRPHKNFPRVLSAFKKLIQEDEYEGKLVAVGIDSQELPEDLRKRVVFFPLSNDQDLRLLYSGADLLVSPSLYEGFGLPVLEAMACGCPVLVGDQGALPEIVGDAGRQVDPYNVYSLWEGIRDILYHKEIRQGLIDRGLKRAAQYTWEKTAQKVLETYDSLENTLQNLNLKS